MPVHDKTLTGVIKMPTITIEGPHIKDLDKKRKLVKELTESASEAYGISKDKIVVLIKENPPENVGVGGQLLINKYSQK